jgi:uncharacterized membrane protein YkoI
MFNHRLKTYSHGLALAMSAILMLSAAFAVPPKKPKLSMQEAQKIALEKEPGTIKSSELEKEHGILIYSFDIVRDNQTHEVGVDANTGKIVEDKIEDPAAEAKEEQEEQAKKSAKHDQKEHK